MITYNALFLSKKAIKELNRDEPSIYGGRITIGFTPEGIFDRDNNLAFIHTCLALGIDYDEVHEEAENSFYFDEATEIPEDLKGVSNALDLMIAKEFYTILFSTLVTRMNNVNCLVLVVEVPNFKDKTQKSNTIDTGFNKKGYATGKSCGVLPWKENCQNDLPEGE